MIILGGTGCILFKFRVPCQKYAFARFGDQQIRAELGPHVLSVLNSWIGMRCFYTPLEAKCRRERAEGTDSQRNAHNVV